MVKTGQFTHLLSNAAKSNPGVVVVVHVDVHPQPVLHNVRLNIAQTCTEYFIKGGGGGVIYQ